MSIYPRRSVRIDGYGVKVSGSFIYLFLFPSMLDVIYLFYR